jgi:hypothetical protein
MTSRGDHIENEAQDGEHERGEEGLGHHLQRGLRRLSTGSNPVDERGGGNGHKAKQHDAEADELAARLAQRNERSRQEQLDHCWQKYEAEELHEDAGRWLAGCAA